MGGTAVFPVVGVGLLIVAAGTAIWPMVVRSTRVLETIAFDYMPGSPKGNPLGAGWTIAYGGDVQPPEFDVVQDPTRSYGLQMTAPAGCAIQYMVSPATAAASQRIKLAIRYSETAMFWLLVQLLPKNGTGPINRQLKIKLQGGSPRQPEQHPEVKNERTAWVASKPLGNGWAALDLNIREMVDLAWGKEGLVHDTLRGVQLRGTVAVSPIVLLERWW